ncbi:hypothetical protein A3D42_01475 [Candidatus Nomurabacteria bacterium RIFCSPHIGHO2_02_FULL_41_18]|uniref:PilN domain-containing protein n=1 Tax=Candidatus Nomurabacteria bacterium RIFCSPHIGHO2_02_FULL_41_18 TaxID=1801754 RepID=A0A1F6W7S6_9BACT|nr:MAG: hypothetical protein A3D42_01475 [Candidatus Nomurabacteria bacterium RIFCSPHIGHO2_02_FULL_41_18]
MEQNFQTSFIPKKPIVADRPVAASSVGLFFTISIFILLTILVSSGALYFYRGLLTKNIATMENDLSLAKNRFEPSRISELGLIDKRLRASTEVLAGHTAISPIFEALEKITMKSVRFLNFEYQTGDGNDSDIMVKLSGMAVGYRSIALQSDLFAENKSFLNPIFSNLSLDNSGNVLFDLTFSVDPVFVNYKNTLLAEEKDKESVSLEDFIPIQN